MEETPWLSQDSGPASKRKNWGPQFWVFPQSGEVTKISGFLLHKMIMKTMANQGTPLSWHQHKPILARKCLLFTTILGRKALICVQRGWYIISHTPFTLPSLFQKRTHHLSWETQPLPTSKWLSTSFNSNFGYPPVNKHSDGDFPPFADVFPLGKGGFPWPRTFTGG